MKPETRVMFGVIVVFAVLAGMMMAPPLEYREHRHHVTRISAVNAMPSFSVSFPVTTNTPFFPHSQPH